MHLTALPRTAARLLGRLRRDRSGLALMEFAFSLPIILGLGMYSVETANLALVNMRVSQIALNLADNAARVGAASTLSTQQLREIDVNDVLQAARFQGQSINLTTQGRITLSSLENVQRTYPDGTSDSAAVQRIHWQRCLGLKSGANYDSTYGPNPTIAAGTDASAANKGVDRVAGMGDPVVNAPPGSALMFVEINYEYKPIVAGWLLTGNQRVHYVASFIVRDNRDFSRLFNPSPTATAATCNLYGA